MAAREDDSLFITYTGVLTGSFQLNTSSFPFDATQCAGGSGTYFFTDTANSTVRIGINPPSIDPNPLFFMIQQNEQALPPPAPGPATDMPTPTWSPSFTFGTPTVAPIPIFSAQPRAFDESAAPGSPDNTGQAAADPVLPPGTTRPGGFKNLLFASMYTLCTQDSQPCGTIHTADHGTATYNAHRMLDLTGPDLLTDDGGDGDGDEPSYTLRGDQSTWASNDTVEWSGLEFSPPENYTNNNAAEPEACAAYRYPPLVWNATTPFTYALRFANASATLSLILTAPLGTVTLGFAGARVVAGPAGPDGNGSGGSAAAAAATEVQVGRGTGGEPRWSFVNGSGFHFDGLVAVADDPVAGGGLYSGQGGLGSGAAAGVVEAAVWASAGWGGGGVVVAVFLTALLL
ncbi:hypothetical protein Daus18300_003842 [Diaporthe australafricana]|uniref:Uncharacterized protein n=1 Tax=Diaporthe australafricana TaxID=127596 RepID=A0ABR3XCY7_9PEZI